MAAGRRSRSGGGAILVVLALIAFALASGGSKKAKAKGGAYMPTGKKLELEKTARGSSADWARSRYASALEAVKAAGETDEEKAAEIALSILTHWSIETGSGAGEWNYNPGNINATGNQDFVMVHDVDGTMHAQRAFESIHDGAAAYVNLLRAARYSGAAALLANNPASSDWFITLGKEGWFDPTAAHSSWDAARSMFENRRRLLEQYAEGA